MVLADTTIWVDHLRRGHARLASLLNAGEVACHAFIIGELACGSIGNRDEVLALLSALPRLVRVDDEEALGFIERHRLMRRGLGLVDVHLLAACRVGSIPLWTRDTRLLAAATDLGIAYT